MPAPHALAVFVPAALVLLIVPGPAVLFIVARSLEQGRRAGVVSALGLSAGGMVHVLAAALGLSALLTSVPVAFPVLKYAGAGYLVYLGVRTLLDRPAASVERSPEAPRSARDLVAPSDGARRRFRTLSGVTYIGLGLWAAVAGRPPSTGR